MSNWDDDQGNGNGSGEPEQEGRDEPERPAASPEPPPPDQWSPGGQQPPPAPWAPGGRQPPPPPPAQWSPGGQSSPPPGQWQPQQPGQPPGQWSPGQGPPPAQWSPGQGPPQGQWQPGGAPPPGDSARFTLGPLTVADILDITFNLFKVCWKQLAIAVLVYAVPAGIFSGAINIINGNHSVNFTSGFGFSNFNNRAHLSGAEVAGIVISYVLLLAVYVFLRPYVQGAITRMVASQYLGREMPAKEAFLGVRHLFWRFVGASILVGLCIAAGLIAFLVGAIVIAVLFTAVIPIISVEEETVFNAMGRSWALMKRRFWPYTGIRILMYIIGAFAAGIVAVIPELIGAGFYAAGAGVLGAFFLAVSSVISSLISLPISAIVTTLIYFDSRVRNEGFDVQMMAARIPQNPPPPQQQ